MSLTNSIFRSQEGSDIRFENGSSAAVSYSDFYDCSGAHFSGYAPVGLGELVQMNCNGDSCDVFYNIFLDPLFIDFPGKDFHLSVGSPCIDAGDPASAYDPDSTITDIGRYWFVPVGVENTREELLDPCLVSLFPNPCTELLNISFSLPEHQESNIRIYDLNGRLMHELNSDQVSGEYVLDISDFCSGIYFCRLEAGENQRLESIVITH